MGHFAFRFYVAWALPYGRVRPGFLGRTFLGGASIGETFFVSNDFTRAHIVTALPPPCNARTDIALWLWVSRCRSTLYRALHDGRPVFWCAGGCLPIRPRCRRVCNSHLRLIHSFIVLMMMNKNEDFAFRLSHWRALRRIAALLLSSFLVSGRWRALYKGTALAACCAIQHRHNAFLRVSRAPPRRDHRPRAYTCPLCVHPRPSALFLYAPCPLRVELSPPCGRSCSPPSPRHHSHMHQCH